MIIKSKNVYKILITMAVLVVIGFWVKNLADGMNGLSSCEEEVRSESFSPNRLLVATSYLTNCGATTGYVTHINIRKNTDPVKTTESGVMVGGEVLSIESKIEILIKWDNNQKLDLKIPHKEFLSLKGDFPKNEDSVSITLSEY